MRLNRKEKITLLRIQKLIIMKKIILSIALVGVFTLATVQAANTMIEQPIIEVTLEDDGFVDVKFDDLNEKVQEAVKGLAQEYDLNALKYNAEKQLTKVEATKKEDQSQKTFYFDVEGKEVVMAEAVEKTEQTEEIEKQEEKSPSAESFVSFINDDNGFVEVKLEDLNEKVQAAINALKETYDVELIKYNAEKQVTKVKVVNKADQTKKKIYFDNEGAETTWEKPVEDVKQETEEIL